MERKIKNHLYFLRHCKTEYGNQNIITGQSNVDILCSEKQIDLTQYCKSNNLIIFSSPLKRCRETIEIFKNTVKYDSKTVFCDELIERNMGVFEGVKRKEALKIYPDFFKDGKLIYEKTPPDGESLSHIFRRVDLFINDILYEEIYDHDVLICSHNHIMKMLYFKIIGIPMEENWYNTKFTEGTVYKLF